MEKNNNKILVVGLIIFILLSLCTSGYLVYDKYLSNKTNVGDKKIDEQETNNKKEEKLNINDKKVQVLYNRIKSINNFDQDLIDLVLNSSKEVTVADIKKETLNYFGYRNLKINQISKDSCKNYANTFTNSKFICSDQNYINIDAGLERQTDVFDETDLKESVEKIFGENTYQKSEALEIIFAEYYIYDSTSSKYVHAYVEGGGTNQEYKKELIDLKQENDQLSLIEHVTFDYEDANTPNLDEKISYNFKLDKNNNYILYSLNLVK